MVLNWWKGCCKMGERQRKKTSNLLVQLCWLSLLWGTDATKQQKGSCWNDNGSWLNRQRCFCWKDSCKGSVRMRCQYYFYRWLLRKTFFAFECSILTLNLVLDYLKVCTNCIAKPDFFNNFSEIKSLIVLSLWLRQTEYLNICMHLELSFFGNICYER